jgi:uncharacterized protein
MPDMSFPIDIPRRLATPDYMLPAIRTTMPAGMTDPLTILLIAATFLVAGGVKGIIGLGLPTISLAVLTAGLGLQPAMAMMLAPSFVTNVWQAVVGGNARAIVARIWPFLTMATVTVWFGAGVLTRVDVSLLSALLGVLLIAYAVVGIGGMKFSIPADRERWAGPVIGAINGVFTGMTGSFAVPGIPYLQALGLPRDMLVQAMGMLFTASTVALALSLGGKNLLTAELGVVSAAAVIPACIGMVIGRRARRNIPEAAFRRVFYLALIVLGGVIIFRSFV